MKNRLYPKKYGQWAGNPAGQAPDYARCCASLHDRYHPGGYQCTRKRGHGPDQAYCKQHDPAVVEARQKEQDRAYQAKAQKRRYEWHGKSFFDTLRQIADGHNDARGLAREVIEKFEKGSLK